MLSVITKRASHKSHFSIAPLYYPLPCPNLRQIKSVLDHSLPYPTVPAAFWSGPPPRPPSPSSPHSPPRTWPASCARSEELSIYWLTGTKSIENVLGKIATEWKLSKTYFFFLFRSKTKCQNTTTKRFDKYTIDPLSFLCHLSCMTPIVFTFVLDKIMMMI